MLPLNFGDTETDPTSPVTVSQSKPLFTSAVTKTKDLFKSSMKNVGSIFMDALEPQLKPVGETINKAIPPRVETYTREEKIANNPAFRKPKIVATKTDVLGPYKVLDSGATVRDVPTNLSMATTTAYQEHPEIPKGLLESVLMQESSMGKNRGNYNPDIGEYAWVVGFTNIAKKELIRNGIQPDLRTPQGAINAMADFIALKQKIKDANGNVVDIRKDPVDIYNNVYSSGVLKPEILQQFKNIVDYYAN